MCTSLDLSIYLSTNLSTYLLLLSQTPDIHSLREEGFIWLIDSEVSVHGHLIPTQKHHEQQMFASWQLGSRASKQEPGMKEDPGPRYSYQGHAFMIYSDMPQSMLCSSPRHLLSHSNWQPRSHIYVSIMLNVLGKYKEDCRVLSIDSVFHKQSSEYIILLNFGYMYTHKLMYPKGNM